VKDAPPGWHDELLDCFKTTSSGIFGMLRRFTSGDHQTAEDLTQETFRKAWQNWAALRELTDEERAGWLTKVAANTAVDTFRHGSCARDKMHDVYARYRPPEPDPYRDALTSIAIQRFIAVTERMPPQRSRVAFYHWRCGWRNGEIAGALGITAAMVSQHIKAARET
jgi:RNA polymerase sigma factor (sigma-70 family)